MERETGDRAAAGPGPGARAGDAARPGDFAGYIARNLDPAYRFAMLALGDPVAAQDAVHDALMAAWQAGGTWPPRALDGLLGRRLVGDCRSALRAPGRYPPDAEVDDAAEPGSEEAARAALERALAGLDPNDQLVLVERLAMPGAIEPVATTLRGRGTLDRRLPAILLQLATRLGDQEGAAPATDLAARLGALFEARDPGLDAPSTLRWRLQRSLIEAEQAAAEQADIAAASGWGFAVKVVFALVLLTLVVAAFSVVRIRQNMAAAPLGAVPAFPLSVDHVGLVYGGVDGPGVHVAATRENLVVAYQAARTWHVSERDCQADVVGVIGADGSAEWLGQLAGHLDRLAGDPASGYVYGAGPGPLCEPGRYASSDGGRTWTRGTLPAGVGGSPAWLGFDPSAPGHLLALEGAGTLYASSDGGTTWTHASTSAVPIGFDSRGRLVGWQPGRLLDSWDGGATWDPAGGGPGLRPLGGAVSPSGTLLIASDGLWWYPIDGGSTLVTGGRVLAVAALDGGAVALGVGPGGRPWLETVTDGQALEVPLPPEIASLQVSGGEVAANSSGAVIALSGQTSAIVFASFAH